MTAYTFFFSSDNFAAASKAGQSGQLRLLSYVGGKCARPMSSFVRGDELFVVGVANSKVRLAGRVVVDGPPVTRAEVEQRLQTRDVINKEIFVLAQPEIVDKYRTDLWVPDEIAQELELTTSDGDPANAGSLRAGSPDPNLFRTPLRLSERSAAALRTLLTDIVGSGSDMQLVDSVDGLTEDDAVGSADDDEYRSRAIKTRRGQAEFRRKLMDAYGKRCQITNCRVEDLLEAAHITPHAEHTDYDLRNGLLLRADVHTLFDLNLLWVDEHYRVRVSEQLRNSEYWRYHGNELDRFPPNIKDFPYKPALARRAELAAWKLTADGKG